MTRHPFFPSVPLLFALMAWNAASGAAEGANLLPNAGFAHGDAEWVPGAGEAVADVAVPGGDTRSLKMVSTAAWSLRNSARVPVVAGAPYRISGWMKLENATAAHWKINWLTSGAQSLESAFPVTGTDGTRDWFRSEWTGPAPAGAGLAEIVLLSGGTEERPGTAWFDAFEITPLDADAHRFGKMLIALASFAPVRNSLKPEGDAVAVAGWKDRAIVVPAAATDQDRTGATLLSRVLAKRFGGAFPVVAEPDAAPGAFISLGRTALAEAAGVEPDPREHAYRIAVADNNVFLLGGARGSIYAVIALLEEDLGCRWYNLMDNLLVPRGGDDADVAPRAYAPPFPDAREPLYRDAWSNPTRLDRAPQARAWGGFNRLQPISYYSQVDADFGGDLANPEFFIHTYCALVPTEKYFAAHPEYFPMRNGKRFPSTYDDGQLCYSSDGVVDVMVETLDAAIARRPGTRIYSVSSNDNTFDNCECPPCTALIKAEGVSGAQLRLANRVADRLAVKYPEIRITTLAYVGSQTPPPTIAPGPNTVVFYAPIRQRGGVLGALPLRDVPQIVEEMRIWNEKTEHLYIWDYSDGVTNELPPPFPNLDLLDDNWQFLVDNGVTGVFIEAAEFGHASLAELKVWYIVKKMWNPSWSLEALLEDFIPGYYGPAAPEIAEYVAFQRAKWKAFRAAYRPGTGFYFDADDIARMKAVLDRALAKAADDAELRRRLDYEMLTVLTLELNRRPKRDAVDAYALVLDRMRGVMDRLGIERYGLRTTREAALAKWRQYVDDIRTGSALPLYDEDSVVLTDDPTLYFGDKRDDPKTVRKYAFRQRGGAKHDWGVQWNFGPLLEQAPNQQVYVARIRYKPELKRKPETGSPLFGIGLWRSGVEGAGMGTVFTPPDLKTDDYQWGYPFTVIMHSPAAEGFFYGLPGAGTNEDEALWFDYLEFIPLEKFADKALAEKLPRITL